MSDEIDRIIARDMERLRQPDSGKRPSGGPTNPMLRMMLMLLWLGSGALGGWITVHGSALCYPYGAQRTAENGMDAGMYIMMSALGPMGLLLSLAGGYTWEQTHDDCEKKMFNGAKQLG